MRKKDKILNIDGLDPEIMAQLIEFMEKPRTREEIERAFVRRDT